MEHLQTISDHFSQTSVFRCLQQQSAASNILQAFGESVSDEEVYQQCAADAVQHMLQGKVASLFMFLGLVSSNSCTFWKKLYIFWAFLGI